LERTASSTSNISRTNCRARHLGGMLRGEPCVAHSHDLVELLDIPWTTCAAEQVNGAN
jgi:hypothetical protein